MKTKLLTLLTLLVLCVTGAWADGTALSSLNWSGISSAPTAYTYSSNNTPSYQASQGPSGDKRSCMLIGNGGQGQTPTITDSGPTVSEGKRWMAFCPAEDCDLAIVCFGNDKIFQLYDKDHYTAKTNVASNDTHLSSFTGKNTWQTWNITGLKAGTWYVLSASSSSSYVYSMTFTATAADTESPSITTDLASAYVAHVGSELTLTVAASHADSYQWYMNEDGDATAKEGDKIAGATSATYTYTPSATGTKKIYCVATNSKATETKTATSAVATVTIGERIWIGLTQTNDGTPTTISEVNYLGTLAAAAGSGITNITIASTPICGSKASVNQRASKATGPDGDYYATNTFKKTVNTSDYDADQWVGYNFTIESGHKATLTNLKATLWDANSNASYTWRVVVENSAGTALYTSGNNTSSTSSMGILSVANPTGLTDLLEGTYTVKLQVYQGGTGKYFAIPYLTFDATVEDYEAPKHTVTTSVNNAEYGEVTATAEYVEGTDAKITATPNAAYKFSSWTIDGTENASTENPYTFSSIDAAHTIQAVFVARKTIDYTVTNEQKGTRTDVFGTEYADDNDEFVAPANKYLSSNNQTLTGWNDGSETKAVGESFDLSGGNKTLSPVFTGNSGATFNETLESSKSDFNVTWSFGNADVALNLEGFGTTRTGYYVKQATINGTPVDIALAIDATNGKLNNSSNSDCAQFNNNTKLTVPVVNNSVISLRGYNNISTTTINGSTEYTGTGTKNVSYTYTGTTGTVDIVSAGEIGYLYTVNVTYPAPAYTVTYSAGDGSGTVPTEESKNEDAQFTLAKQSTMVAPTGKYFVGWNDGTKDYAPGETFTMPAENVTFTAQWATSAEENHYHYSYKDAAHYDGTAFKNPLGATAESGDNKTLTDGNLCSSLGGITSVAIANAVYDGKSNHMDAYLKLKKDDATSKVTITVADGYVATLTIKAGGYSKNPTINISDATLISGTVGGVATTEDNYNTLVYTLTSGAHDITSASQTLYISEIDIVTTQSVSGTISASGWNTFSSNYPLDLSTLSATSDVEAYYASATAGSSVTMTKTTATVPAGEGLMIKGTAGEEFTINVAQSGTAIDGNLLVGLPNGGTVPVAGEGVNYVFGWTDASNPGFYKIESDTPTLGAGKAYLHTTSALGSKLGLIFDDGETTSIKLNVNDSLDSDAAMYNLAGQKVSNSYKGIVIVNGKKYVCK